jgi:hypothetical protein
MARAIYELQGCHESTRNARQSRHQRMTQKLATTTTTVAATANQTRSDVPAMTVCILM